MKMNTKSSMITNEILSELFQYMRTNSDEESLCDVIRLLINYLNNEELNDLEIELNKLANSTLKDILLNIIVNTDYEANTEKMRNSSNYRKLTIGILESILLLLDNGEFEKAMIAAYSVHNYPSFLLGEFNYVEENFWHSLQGRYYSQYNEYFLNRSTHSLCVWK